ncbi:MAG: glutamate racemase [Acidobacteria bacterium]|nr:glutamate racemase [Acidobacteriota bacterium]
MERRKKQLVKRIGIFDSGAGGLTVLKELKASISGVKYYYLGDTARLPYGTKSSETIIRYTKQNAAFLIGKKIDVLIVACNTASAYAIPELRKFAADIPVTGVIHPGAKRAAKMTENGKIGIIGTRATISSGKYQKELKELDPDFRVFTNPAPLLVPLVEEGMVTGEVTEKLISMYLEPLLRKRIDTLILGCTHYPLLKQTIHEMYPGIMLVDSAEPIRDILLAGYEFPSGNGKTEIYVTDYPEGFGLLSHRFLEGNFDKIEHIDLQKLWKASNGTKIKKTK